MLKSQRKNFMQQTDGKGVAIYRSAIFARVISKFSARLMQHCTIFLSPYHKTQKRKLVPNESERKCCAAAAVNST